MKLPGRGAALVLAFALSHAGSFALAADATAYLGRAAVDATEREALVRHGKEASFFCANCHGDTGTARSPDVPNLAGQHPAYVVGQIEAFLGGKRRNDFMQGLMKVLAERDKAAIALYYAGMNPVAAGLPPGPRATEGGQHFQRLCASCHQADARGAETIPRLAGQQPEYLRLSLTRYLSKSGGRTHPEMSAAVGQLGAANIEAVVEFLASLE